MSPQQGELRDALPRSWVLPHSRAPPFLKAKLHSHAVVGRAWWLPPGCRWLAVGVPHKVTTERGGQKKAKEPPTEHAQEAVGHGPPIDDHHPTPCDGSHR